MEALRSGAPVDLLFQSIAGTEAANRSFGVNLALLAEATRPASRSRAARSARMEPPATTSCTSKPARAARSPPTRITASTSRPRSPRLRRRPHFQPMLVNTVVGFIGPEYLYDGKQIIRAGLEDHFCGKLLGLPMGCDVCYTNHAEADQDDMDALLTLLGAAGVNYIMGVPGADDVMLNYQSTSFHDALYLRRVLGLRPAPELLRFQLDHARARDAVYRELDPASLGVPHILLRSAAGDRRTYLQRPDLGRKLSADARLEKGDYDAAIVIADGLSAPAVHRHAVPLLEALSMARLAAEDWRLAPLTVVLQARVADRR
jgi:hypothetical protein